MVVSPAAGLRGRSRCTFQTIPMKTQFAREEDFKDNRRWYHVDASGKVLGRMATEIARRLMGKDRPDYTPHVDTGAYVVVTNAEKVRLTGRKWERKEYKFFSGYPGGQRTMTAEQMLEKHAEDVIIRAVKNMLPKNRLGSRMLKKLKVYRGPDHPHTYQKPEKLEV